MGNCDSITNRSKKISRLLTLQDSSRNTIGSSTSLPKVSSIFHKYPPTILNLKKNNSVEKTNPHQDSQYILPIELAKREDITQKYKISKQILGDGATSLVFLAENSAKKKFAIKRIPKEKNTINHKVMIKEAEICLKFYFPFLNLCKIEMFKQCNNFLIRMKCLFQEHVKFNQTYQISLYFFIES